ncbi:MAG: pyrimidine dimer DNA glycosylase/endonuclease V [bacterium]
MRLWSLHPEYLDVKGLVALWREGLLAQKVLLGKTRGYKNHPQIIRFKNTKDPIGTISRYLFEVVKEARRRGYNFDVNKLLKIDVKIEEKIPVTKGQIEYEFKLLKNKLKKRDRKKCRNLNCPPRIKINRIFKRINGGIEKWENVV